MPIRYTEEGRIFNLSTANTSYLFCVYQNDYLFHMYYGKKLRHADTTYRWRPYPSGFSPIDQSLVDQNYSQDLIPAEYPIYGHGDFRMPALTVRFANGSRLLDLQYESYEIEDGKTPLCGMPCTDRADQTLHIVLRDRPTNVKVILSYSIFEEKDIIARSVRVVNETDAPITLNGVMSTSTDLLLGNDYDMISLDGWHVRERQIERKPLRNGLNAVESRRGASSNHHNPFAVFAEKNTTEFTGSAYGVMLVYSGNFTLSAEKDAFGAVRVQAGIHPYGFEWKLGAGETFQTPEALLSYTANGLNALSQNYHNIIRENLGHTVTVGKRRPIIINNWEATYFNFNEEKLINLINSCKGLGIEIFVLDDGWFGHRDDDTTSLGDWFVDKKKLPNGLAPIIEACEAIDMKFGLWFEPEMISEDSELYRAHPDWPIGEPGRPYCRGRQQLILDLSREDVYQYLYETLSGMLRSNRISYVKWDMNRNITDAYAKTLAPDQQGEIFHRYMLNYYRLLNALTTEFPDVAIEGCSGGGGRFDAGELYFTPQIWTSDDSDAAARLRIQYGTSLAYPPVCMTAHVSASPNHQLERVTPFKTRGLVAMSASFGYELNPLNLSDEERAQIAEQTAQYKKWAPLVVNGDFYRLLSPFENDDCAWMFVSKDKSEAFAIYVRQMIRPADNGRRIRFAGLDPQADYYIEEFDRVFGGDELMYAGLPVENLLDYQGVSYTMKKVSE